MEEKKKCAKCLKEKVKSISEVVVCHASRKWLLFQKTKK
jgi:hypothetical protein